MWWPGVDHWKPIHGNSESAFFCNTLQSVRYHFFIVIMFRSPPQASVKRILFFTSFFSEREWQSFGLSPERLKEVKLALKIA